MLGEAEGVRWVLKHKRTAFTPAGCQRAARIEPGDAVVLYVARGAYHNPTRDRGEVVAAGRVAGSIRRLSRPIELADREFVCDCPLEFDRALPERQGIPMASLVDELFFVKRKAAWGQYVKTTLVRLPPEDMVTLSSAIEEWGRT